MARLPFLATVALAALVTAAPTATAQGRNRSGHDHAQRSPSQGESGGGQQAQGGERRAAPREGGQVQQPREDRGAGQTRSAGPRQEVRSQDNGRQEIAPAPPQQGQPQRYAQRWPDGTRSNSGGQQYNSRTADGRYAVPRAIPAPRYNNHVYVQPRPNYYVYRYPAYRYYAPYPYYGYSYYDPYYRGDFFWGFSTHGWASSGAYGAAYGTGYAYSLGKLRLQVQPREAEVYIDGYYAGTVDDFDGRLQGLQLEAGNYHVEISLPGFAPLQFDAQVSPGRTTTYRGELLPDQSPNQLPPPAPF